VASENPSPPATPSGRATTIMARAGYGAWAETRYPGGVDIVTFDELPPGDQAGWEAAAGAMAAVILSGARRLRRR
jgi:hypothetical protein